MRFRFAKVYAPRWSPLDDYPDARVYRADDAVASGSSTRWRTGVVSTTVPKAYSAIEGQEVPLDGQGFVELTSGRLILAGGAPQGHAVESVNTVWGSDDKETWVELQPNAAGSSTRPAPGHTFGFFKKTHGGVKYVYWLGGDPFTPTGDVFRIPESALDVGGDPDTPWERVSTTCPTSGWALYLYGVLGDDIFVGAGQVDINDGAANKVWSKSTDGGATWTSMGAIVPADVWGTQVGPLPELEGKLWVAGSARYDSTVNDFSNGVFSFDGSNWSEELADGHSQFPKSRYHSVVAWNGRLWRFNGSTWDGVTLDSDTASAHYSSDGATWTEWTLPLSLAETHAQATLASQDGSLYTTDGFQTSKLHAFREHAGALVSSVPDLGGDGLDLAQSDNAKKPILDPTAFDNGPGLVFTGAQVLDLAAPDRDIVDEVLVICFRAKTLNFDIGSNQGANPPATVVGATNGSSWNNAGYNGDAVRYRHYNAGWQDVDRSSALNRDVPHVIVIVHTASEIKIYVDGVQAGATATGAFDTSWTGWDAVGAGYLEDDYGAFVLDKLVVLRPATEPDAVFLSKIQTWMQE